MPIFKRLTKSKVLDQNQNISNHIYTENYQFLHNDKPTNISVKRTGDQHIEITVRNEQKRRIGWILIFIGLIIPLLIIIITWLDGMTYRNNGTTESMTFFMSIFPFFIGLSYLSKCTKISIESDIVIIKRTNSMDNRTISIKDLQIGFMVFNGHKNLVLNNITSKDNVCLDEFSDTDMKWTYNALEEIFPKSCVSNLSLDIIHPPTQNNYDDLYKNYRNERDQEQ